MNKPTIRNRGTGEIIALERVQPVEGFIGIYALFAADDRNVTDSTQVDWPNDDPTKPFEPVKPVQ